MLTNQTSAQLSLSVMSTQFTISMVIFSFLFEYCDNFAFLLFLWNFSRSFEIRLLSKSKGFLLGGYLPVVVSFNFLFLPLIQIWRLFSKSHQLTFKRTKPTAPAGWMGTIKTDESDVLGFRWNI